jgi:hypothetical protein
VNLCERQGVFFLNRPVFSADAVDGEAVEVSINFTADEHK